MCLSEQPQATSTTTSSLNRMSDDILLRIFDYLHFDDKIRLRRTSHRWWYLLDSQLNRVKALRLGFFSQGGYSVTSGLQDSQCSHNKPNHRRTTGTLFNEALLNMPPDLDSQCFSVNQYGYLYRSLKHSSQSITMLSLGRINISYRMLTVIAHNLPHLEHLELIACASENEQQRQLAIQRHLNSRHTHHSQECNNNNNNNIKDNQHLLPSVESCGNPNSSPNHHPALTLYNQHQDELLNMRERISRSTFVRNCDLVKQAKLRNYWPHFSHLLVKDCNLLDEISLSLILAITSQTLTRLSVESSQYLTGEFLNYCGPKINTLTLKHCPLIQGRFLDDLMKIKQFTETPVAFEIR